MAKKGSKKLPADQRDELLAVLEARFDKNKNRHKGIQWDKVRKKLEDSPDKLWSLNEMEQSGGAPDVVGQGKKADKYLFIDCSQESPRGRRSLCYDREALEARKKNKPEGTAVERAEEMGGRLLTEDEYRKLQEFGPFDTTTSSWLETPPQIRKEGGAMFGDYRFGAVWVYHNGADSYYAARGFRCLLEV